MGIVWLLIALGLVVLVIVLLMGFSLAESSVMGLVAIGVLAILPLAVLVAFSISVLIGSRDPKPEAQIKARRTQAHQQINRKSEDYLSEVSSLVKNKGEK